VSVHDHPPYRPMCSERMVNGQLRGACLNDDGTPKGRVVMAEATDLAEMLLGERAS
jgi:hypothetical protein